MVESNGDCEETGGQCDFSEGKVGRNGSWKVELTLDGCGAEMYDICLVHEGGTLVLAQDVSPNNDCELKDSGGAASVAGLFLAPAIIVTGNGGEACTDVTEFVSGFNI